jgi:biotin carboxyl carrier protein
MLNDSRHVAWTVKLQISDGAAATATSGASDGGVTTILTNLGIDVGAAKKINDIKAPMPGLVLKVLVKDGDVIKKGDNLLVLEAMKMENSIKAPADATIKAVKITAGDKVEKNQVMILLA